MARSVKCLYCGNEIDRDTNNEWRQLNNKRYVHEKCYQDHERNKEYKNKIHEKMKDLCENEYLRQKVNSQIKMYTEKDNINEYDIYQTLVYWYDIKHNDPSQANGGIGIVPYVYKDAKKYFKEEEELKKKRNKISKEDIEKELKQREAPTEIVSRKIPIQKPKRVNYFMLD